MLSLRPFIGWPIFYVPHFLFWLIILCCCRFCANWAGRHSRYFWVNCI